MTERRQTIAAGINLFARSIHSGYPGGRMVLSEAHIEGLTNFINNFKVGGRSLWIEGQHDLISNALVQIANAYSNDDRSFGAEDLLPLLEIMAQYGAGTYLAALETAKNFDSQSTSQDHSEFKANSKES